jgi:hypothetical protein
MIISLLSTNDMFQLQLSSPEYSLRFCDKEKKRLHKKLERERVEDGVRHRERERERVRVEVKIIKHKRKRLNRFFFLRSAPCLPVEELS